MRSRIAVLMPAVALLAISTTDIGSAAPAGASGLPLVVSGTIVDTDGGRSPGSVELLAWPETHDLEVGDRVDLVPVATGVVGGDGAFALAAARPARGRSCPWSACAAVPTS